MKNFSHGMNPLPMENLLERLDNLPTLPVVALRILEAVKDDKIKLDELGEILALDPPLSGKILGLINSAFYALPVKTTSVSYAVKLLGLNTVKKVALSFSLLHLVKSQTEDEFNYPEFWKNSVMAAVICRLLIKEVLPALAEDGFTLGLLHEIGRLGLNQSMPKQYELVLKERRDTMCDFYEAEKQILGFTHMELSGAMIKQWGLPDFFSEPVELHHLPEALDKLVDPAGLLGKVLFLASQVVEYFSGPRKILSLGILKNYLGKWGFSSVIQVEDLLEETHRQLKEISDLFEVPPEEESAYPDLIEKARRELIHISDRLLQELLVQQKRVESLENQVMRDGLTGLYNYKSFHYFLNQEFYRTKRYGHPLTLIMSDVDYFKSINDNFGHLAGDKVLRLLSQCLSDSLRNSDILARYGGDEFGILLPDTPGTDSLLVVERLRHRAERLAVEYDGRVISVTMSFGVVWLQPELDLSKDDWVKRADQALYEAKRLGRNQMCVQAKAELAGTQVPVGGGNEYRTPIRCLAAGRN